MESIINTISNTVPLSQFEQGHAKKMFEEVKRTGIEVVMKNNTAECVLLSLDEYVRLMDEMNQRFELAGDDIAGFDEVEIK